MPDFSRDEDLDDDALVEGSESLASIFSFIVEKEESGPSTVSGLGTAP